MGRGHVGQTAVKRRPQLKEKIAGWVFLAVVILIAGKLVRTYSGPPHIEPALALSAILWCVFTIYWSAAAKNASAATKSESRKSRQVHQLLLNIGLLLLFIPMPWMTQRFMPVEHWVAAAGLAFQIACMALAVWARRHLGVQWSGEITIKVEHRLICSGPYRKIRHPIYTAILGMFVGTTLVSGETHALLGLVMAVFAYWRKIRLEEANLNEAFGVAYGMYRRSTWALLPGVY